MTVMIVDFDIIRADQNSSQSARAEFIDELYRGRREDQIYFDRNRCFLNTPEPINVLARRLVSRNKILIDRDRVVIIEARSKKICVLGGCDMRIFDAFSSYKLIDISY